MPPPACAVSRGTDAKDVPPQEHQGGQRHKRQRWPRADGSKLSSLYPATRYASPAVDCVVPLLAFLRRTGVSDDESGDLAPAIGRPLGVRCTIQGPAGWVQLPCREGADGARDTPRAERSSPQVCGMGAVRVEGHS